MGTKADIGNPKENTFKFKFKKLIFELQKANDIGKLVYLFDGFLRKEQLELASKEPSLQEVCDFEVNIADCGKPMPKEIKERYYMTCTIYEMLVEIDKVFKIFEDNVYNLDY